MRHHGAVSSRWLRVTSTFGRPTSRRVATACRFREDKVTWSKSTRRTVPTPARTSIWAAWLPATRGPQSVQAHGAEVLGLAAPHPRRQGLPRRRRPCRWTSGRRGRKTARCAKAAPLADHRRPRHPPDQRFLSFKRVRAAAGQGTRAGRTAAFGLSARSAPRRKRPRPIRQGRCGSTKQRTRSGREGVLCRGRSGHGGPPVR